MSTKLLEKLKSRKMICQCKEYHSSRWDAGRRDEWGRGSRLGSRLSSRDGRESTGLEAGVDSIRSRPQKTHGSGLVGSQKAE